MNKLFIIGNGFDLSLGLKTKYEDFIFWLFKKSLNEAIKLKNESPTSSALDIPKDDDNTIKTNGWSDNEIMYMKIMKKYSFDAEQLNTRFSSITPFVKEFKQSDRLEIEIKNSILRKTITDIHLNWVDIESTYFSLLLTHLNTCKIQSQHNNINGKTKVENWEIVKSNVEKLNGELKEISDKLKEYLRGDVSINGLKQQIAEHIPIFKRPVVETDRTTHKAAAIHLLNFNYTNTIESCCDPIEFQINRIHGTLEEEIIFGYGDEMDKAYKEIEELNENSFFEHIKSFGYFRNDRYRQLLGFMASGEFQVNIYGHSCGLSDRVLLNEIFEHDNCNSIRVYHMNKSDYINKTMEISRHFTSNKLLRNRILPFNPEDAIPQVNAK